jgi:hypothetical protein
MKPVASEVTKPTPDERYVSRSGVLQVNVHEAARLAEAREPQHAKDDRAFGRTSLNDLEMALLAMTERVTDREQSVASLGPQVLAAEVRVEKLRAEVAGLTQAVAQHVPGTRSTLKNTEIKLRFATDALAALALRLDTSKKVLASAKAITLDWYKKHGAALDNLRKLTAK